MSVRGIHTDVTDMREKIFTEVARLAYEGGRLFPSGGASI